MFKGIKLWTQSRLSCTCVCVWLCSVHVEKFFRSAAFSSLSSACLGAFHQAGDCVAWRGRRPIPSQLGVHVHMKSAKFADFLTPSPHVTVTLTQPITTVIFWGTPYPPPTTDVICTYPQALNEIGQNEVRSWLGRERMMTMYTTVWDLALTTSRTFH